jgi:hypothetical protein
MTILNAWVSPERVIVAMDTAGDGSCGPNRESGEVSKMIPLVHASCIFAGRGSTDFMRWAFEAFHTQPRSDFDSIAVGIPSALAIARAQMIEMIERHGISDYPLAQSFFVFGWSHHRQRMAGVHWKIDADRNSKYSNIGDSYIAPWTSELGEAPLMVPSDDELLAMARRQAAHFQLLYPGAGFGGRLVVAEITQGSMLIRDLGSLNPSGTHRDG